MLFQSLFHHRSCRSRGAERRRRIQLPPPPPQQLQQPVHRLHLTFPAGGGVQVCACPGAEGVAGPRRCLTVTAARAKRGPPGTSQSLQRNKLEFVFTTSFKSLRKVSPRPEHTQEPPPPPLGLISSSQCSPLYTFKFAEGQEHSAIATV
uniref:Uncharacterized protein n=1 Tax=Knipowitschia caucasica TaxID=637954 RepID=A0AAV2LV40_KNICA